MSATLATDVVRAIDGMVRFRAALDPTPVSNSSQPVPSSLAIECASVEARCVLKFVVPRLNRTAYRARSIRLRLGAGARNHNPVFACRTESIDKILGVVHDLTAARLVPGESPVAVSALSVGKTFTRATTSLGHLASRIMGSILYYPNGAAGPQGRILSHA